MFMIYLILLVGIVMLIATFIVLIINFLLKSLKPITTDFSQTKPTKSFTFTVPDDIAKVKEKILSLSSFMGNGRFEEKNNNLIIFFWPLSFSQGGYTFAVRLQSQENDKSTVVEVGYFMFAVQGNFGGRTPFVAMDFTNQLQHALGGKGFNQWTQPL